MANPIAANGAQNPVSKRTKFDNESFPQSENGYIKKSVTAISSRPPAKVPSAPHEATMVTTHSEDEDDQTAALINTYESTSDSASQEGGPSKPSNRGVASLPAPPLNPEFKSPANASSADGPGTISISHIPHGFYEQQMRAYFSQFGELLHLRLSRNRRTGASKHYAFAQFASAEVAKIVADTMNNYLIFGHVLKVRYIPESQVHQNLFKGADKKFKVVPWAAIDRSRLKSAERKAWEKRVSKEEERREKRAEQLKALGYEFETPQLKSVASVPVKKRGDEDTSATDEDTTGSVAEKTKGIAAAPAKKNDLEVVLEKQKYHPKRDPVPTLSVRRVAEGKGTETSKTVDIPQSKPKS